MAKQKKPVKSASEILEDRAVLHSIHLERLKNSQEKEVLKFLNNNLLPDLRRQINSTLGNMSNKPKIKGLRSTEALKRMAKNTRGLIKNATREIKNKHAKELLEIASMEAKFQVAAMQSVFPVGVSLALPDTVVLASAIASTPFEGRILAGWWESVSLSAQAEFQRQLNLGLVQGESIQQMTSRLFGHSGGSAFNKLRRNAVAVVRTATTAATVNAKEEMYKVNKEYIRKVMYVATLDSRTTDICGSLDGREFQIGRGPRPPMHFNCRSTTYPVPRPMKDQPFKVRDLSDERTRASMNGPVPAKRNYREWLKGQPPSVQDQALGKGRAEIFRKDPRSPDKAFERFVNDKHQSVSLSEIKKLEGI